jgi:ubiquinone/menaquinone biosynthesis C-methylase UbiE
MGFYQRWIVPRLINLAMRNRSLDAYRQRTIGAASGLVLEIGVGSGQNLPLYGSAVHRVYAIDPSMELLHMARNRIAEARLPVSLIRASVEQLPFAGTIFDTIIMTWTLCSIPKPVAALIEMRRVLKPGGNLVFVHERLLHEIVRAVGPPRQRPCVASKPWYFTLDETMKLRHFVPS